MTDNTTSIIHWMDNTTTTYTTDELPYLRRSKGDGSSSGFEYLKPNSVKSDKYETPRDIIRIPKDFVELRQAREQRKEENMMMIRSASITEKKLPAHN